MGSQNRRRNRKTRIRVAQTSYIRIWTIFCAVLCVISGHGMALADPLDFLAPWSIGTEFMYSWIWGTMSYDQASCCGFGSINELRNDLGLPQDNQTYRVYATVRPLEHHMLRVFGSVPELYQSQNVLKKDMRLTQLPGAVFNAVYPTSNTDLVFPKGTLVNSKMQTAQFGFGYDLDFLTGPGHAAGMQGELRYIDLRLSISDNNTIQVPPGKFNSYPPDTGNSPPGMGYQYYNTTLDELVPTLGAHAQAVLPFGFGNMFPDLTLGGYTRMNFGIWPNYLNYVDIQAGLQLNSGQKCGSRRFLIAKFGLEHESILHDGQMRTGRSLELKREGLTCALEAVF